MRIPATFCVTVAAVLLAGACAQRDDQPRVVAETSQPLIGGDILTDDPKVVALTTGGSSSFCSGTLISPSVVLTAAHCIDMVGADPNLTVFFGDDVTSDGRRIGVQKTQRHLGWTGDLAQNQDIGVMLLNNPQDPTWAAPVNTTAPQVDDSYRVAGFGIYDQQNQVADGKKRSGVTTISQALDPPGGDEILINDSDLIVCFGDSGGPGFVTIDDVEYVAGVHSWTSGGNCGPPNGDTRVDVYAENFVIPWIQDNDPACKEDGLCAKIGCIDDPDCTPCGPDGTCVTDCPLPDVDCTTQELGELCRADSQCTTGLCVFWQPDPSTHFCSRECSPTADDCPGGMSCQNIAPFGNVCYYDDPPEGVIGDACEQATECGSYICEENQCVTRCDLSVNLICPPDFECRSVDSDNAYCFALDSGGGGCRAGSGHAGGALAILLFGALVIACRRPSTRRRRCLAQDERTRSDP